MVQSSSWINPELFYFSRVRASLKIDEIIKLICQIEPSNSLITKRVVLFLFSCALTCPCALSHVGFHFYQ
jgi:hypothetical protein